MVPPRWQHRGFGPGVASSRFADHSQSWARVTTPLIRHDDSYLSQHKATLLYWPKVMKPRYQFVTILALYLIQYLSDQSEKSTKRTTGRVRTLESSPCLQVFICKLSKRHETTIQEKRHIVNAYNYFDLERAAGRHGDQRSRDRVVTCLGTSTITVARVWAEYNKHGDAVFIEVQAFLIERVEPLIFNMPHVCVLRSQLQVIVAGMSHMTSKRSRLSSAHLWTSQIKLDCHYQPTRCAVKSTTRSASPYRCAECAGSCVSSALRTYKGRAGTIWRRATPTSPTVRCIFSG